MARWRFEYESRNVPLLNLLVQAQGRPVALWGQEDFCASFKVNLERFLLPAHFVLEYWAGMSEGAPRP